LLITPTDFKVGLNWTEIHIRQTTNAANYYRIATPSEQGRGIYPDTTVCLNIIDGLHAQQAIDNARVLIYIARLQARTRE